MTEKTWEQIIEEDLMWQELEWAEYEDEQEYYSVCKDS